MNILFVNYGDFTTNSLNHIGGFAGALYAQGHACVVAVPERKGSLDAIVRPFFVPATYGELLRGEVRFPDGRPPDIIHAWTPRECVRRFVLAYQETARARLIIHLEDNEEHLLSSWIGEPIESIRGMDESTLAERGSEGLSHPLRYRQFLRVADGVTLIVPSLKEFVPAGVPTALLPPGVDFNLYRPQEPDAALRREVGLAPADKVIVYTGSCTFANEPEILDLYLAVGLLRERGVPARLVRTGISSPTFEKLVPGHLKPHVIELGFVEKSRLPALLGLADVLVQPGRPGPFNDYRLPSKLPEFLASGRPVILADANVARDLRDGVDAIILRKGSPEEIAAACARVLNDPKLAARLSENGPAVARQHFDLTANAGRLASFYESVRAKPLRAGSTSTVAGGISELTLALNSAADAPPGEAAAIAAEVAPLVGRLERNEMGRADREKLAREKEMLAHKVDMTEQHSANLETEIAATRTHVRNLQALLNQAQEAAAGRTVFNAESERRTAELEADIQRLNSELAGARDEIGQRDERIRLTDNHVGNLTAELADARGRLKLLEVKYASNARVLDALRRQIELNNRKLAELGTRADRLDAELKLTRDHAANLENVRASLEAGAAALTAHAAALTARLDEATRRSEERERKVLSMQRSFSWRATAPLRALRRLFLDPPRPPTPPPPNGPAVGRPLADAGRKPAEAGGNPQSTDAGRNPSIWRSVDFPQSWTLPPRKTVIRGWCFADDGRKLDGVRAVLPDRVVEGTYGFKRLDVVASVRGKPQAEYCGWKIDVELREGDDRIDLQVRDESGTWHGFFHSGMRVGEGLAAADLSNYEKWIEVYDPRDAETLRGQAAKAAALPRRPLISVVMPVYNTPERWLRRAIESVRAQTYDNWELCVADDASTEPHVRPLLEERARADSRIKVTFRPKNGHISAASNSALELATGEFAALLDHDDELAPGALFEMAAAIDARPEADYLFSDEDKIDEEGRRFEPYFKPDYLPDLFRAQNYLSHLSVYRTALVREVGGFRVGYEGSQDWDLALRVIERTSADRIVHVPKVLYHWRAIPGSTALLLSEKNYPVEAARRALADHYRRAGQEVELLPVPGDHWRVRHRLPSPTPLVSLIIPTRNRLPLLRTCVESILGKTTHPNYEVLIVDNESDDPETIAWLRRIEGGKVRVLHYPGPFNYAAINNAAVEQVRGELVGLLNNDLEVINGDWLDEMASQALRPGIGCVGAMLYYPNNAVQHAGVVLGLGGVAGHAFRDLPRGGEGKFNRARLVQNYSAVTAACLVVRRSIYREVGGLDEKDLAVAFNDIDFCLKVRKAGYLNLWTPFAELYHHESASRGTDDTPEKQNRFQREVETMLRRWGAALTSDPAYNPNLTLELTDFSLASPPRVPSMRRLEAVAM